MPKQLFILRHGKSDWHAQAGSDFDRPLNSRGKKQVRLIGSWLKAQGIIPDCIVSSPAVRARQTVERICEEIGVEPSRIQWRDDFYLADSDTLWAEVVSQFEHSDSVLIVGHNPGMEMLLYALCGQAIPLSQSGKGLATANLAHIELIDGKGRLRQLVRPDEIGG